MKEQPFWTNKAYLMLPIPPSKWGLAVLLVVSAVIDLEFHHYLNEPVLFLY